MADEVLVKKSALRIEGAIIAPVPASKPFLMKSLLFMAEFFC
jgi:hypothetical protein